MKGIQWTQESSMDDIGVRYAEAYVQYYAPFMDRHDYLLEQYLVNYAYRTLFPFGNSDSNPRLRNEKVHTSIMARYMLLIAHYAISRTVLIGMAGFHRSAFDLEHAVKLIQSSSKTFEHSLRYSGAAIELLAGKGMTSSARLRPLIT
jgi:lysine-N-methylase